MSRAANNQNSEDKLTGLSGWLILVGIDIVFLLLRFIYGIASSYDFFFQSINRSISAYVTVGLFVDIGAVIMFGVLGFLPGWIIAKILHSAGKLRIPREVELAGTDFNLIEAGKADATAVSADEK